MRFDWSEYLNLARVLAGQTLTVSSMEACQRSAVSRAYYAAFCQARNYLENTLGITIRDGNVHKRVRVKFKNRADFTSKKIGNNLNRLRIHRNQADYDDYISDLSHITENAIKIGSKIISDIEDL